MVLAEPKIALSSAVFPSTGAIKSDSSVPFILWPLFSPRLAVYIDRIKTTRFHICIVLQCNFHAFCITENAHTKHEEQTERKLTIFINKSSANIECNLTAVIQLIPKILCILAQQHIRNRKGKVNIFDIVYFIRLVVRGLSIQSS